VAGRLTALRFTAFFTPSNGPETRILIGLFALFAAVDPKSHTHMQGWGSIYFSLLVERLADQLQQKASKA
jgi:hypothetical protein